MGYQGPILVAGLMGGGYRARLRTGYDGVFGIRRVFQRWEGVVGHG